MLATNTATTVHQRLRDEHGLAVGVPSFRRYLWLEFPEAATADRVTVLRPEVEPGSEAQIDYGYLGTETPLHPLQRRLQSALLEPTSGWWPCTLAATGHRL